MSSKDSVKVQCRGKTLAKETEEESNITKKDAIHCKSDGKCQAMARGPKKGHWDSLSIPDSHTGNRTPACWVKTSYPDR